MFKIYDLNYNEIRFPVDDLGFGLKSLDIDIGPILYENIYTQSSRADKLVKRYPKDRTVTLHAMFTSYNKNVADWRLKRDVIYEFFRTLGVFYVAEEYQPFKLLKVLVDTDYLPDRPVNIWGMLEIPLKIIDTPFKQSLHTTLDIDREGVRWNDKWGYGMGLSSEKREWGYSYSPRAETMNLTTDLFEQGNIHTGRGDNLVTTTHARTKGFLVTKKNDSCKLTLNDSSDNAQYIRIYHYNADNSYISDDAGMHSVSGDEYTFTAIGEKMRLVVYPKSNRQVLPSDIGTLTRISISGYPEFNHRIVFFNAGTEEVKLIRQKESEVTLNLKSNANWIEIYDGKQTFRLNKAVKSGDTLLIKGHQILLNGSNVAGNSNRVFLTVKKGWNDWEVRGLGNFKFSINFRFLYD